LNFFKQSKKLCNTTDLSGQEVLRLLGGESYKSLFLAAQSVGRVGLFFGRGVVDLQLVHVVAGAEIFDIFGGEKPFLLPQIVVKIFFQSILGLFDLKCFIKLLNR
jgi:hypothetical protein